MTEKIAYEETKQVKVQVFMPEELRRLAKVCAASAGITLNGLIVNAIEKELKQTGSTINFDFGAALAKMAEGEHQEGKEGKNETDRTDR